jgi:hypothetical protein
MTTWPANPAGDVPWLGELDQTPATDCAVVAALGLCAFASNADGLMTIPHRELFERFGISSNPEFGPTFISDIDRMVSASFPGHSLDRVSSWDAVLPILRAGGSVMLSGDYSQLAKQWTYTTYKGGHAVRCFGLAMVDVTLCTSVSDALGPRHWVPIVSLEGFAMVPYFGVATIRAISHRGQWAPPSVYTVKPGDNLTAIARACGVTVAQLVAVNKAKYPSLAYNANLIRVGWLLNIPGR